MPDVGNLIVLDYHTSGGASTLGSITNIENLAGTDNAMTELSAGGFSLGSGGGRHVWLGRAMATGAVSLTLTTNAGADNFARLYEFTNTSAGTTLATVVEHGAATFSQQNGTSTTIQDADVTTVASHRLACNFPAISNDETMASFTGETGSDWTLATSFVSSEGTTGAIGLQTAPMATSGTVGGGSFTIAVSSGYHCLGFGIIPAATTIPSLVQSGAGVAITGVSGTVEIAATTVATLLPTVSQLRW